MDQQFSLSWNNFHGNLSKGFASLLGNAEFVDVTLAVEGHLLQAHKVILSICSPYFKRMFQMNPCQHPIVVLRDVSHKAMRDLLQFMYHGEVSVKREDLTSFIGTAEVLQIKGLTNKQADEESIDKNNDVHKKNNETHNNSPETQSFSSEHTDGTAEDPGQNNESELSLLKQREFIDRLQKLTNLKRKSEEFIQKNFYNSTDTYNSDKKQKKAKPNEHKVNNYEQYKNVFDNPVDATKYNLNKADIQNNDDNDNTDHEMVEGNGEIKTECEDSDIIVTYPAVCTTPKSDTLRDSQKEHLEYTQSPQDNCSSLSSLFMDLKNLVNGKAVESDISRAGYEEASRGMFDHRLVTIPQKEDGKKKYPQRSCRLCWKLGKRRDTRFMCGSCELPFCKTPCFEVHFSNMMKSSQLHGYYYAS